MIAALLQALTSAATAGVAGKGGEMISGGENIPTENLGTHTTPIPSVTGKLINTILRGPGV